MKIKRRLEAFNDQKLRGISSSLTLVKAFETADVINENV